MGSRDRPPLRINLRPSRARTRPPSRGAPVAEAPPDEAHPPPLTATPEASRLARKLAALPEPAMRAHVLGELLGREEPEALVPLLDEVQWLGRKGGPPFDMALLALATVLSGETVSYEVRQGLYTAARRQGRRALMRLFFSSLPKPDTARRQGPPRDYTLGHRKWLARGTRREVLARLVHDPEPEVMPNLLRNPRLVERDVVDIAARRPVDPEVLRQVFDSPRWIARYAVKRTLVLNPYSPTELSLRLLGFLTRQDLKLVATMRNLPPAVQQAAQQLLEARKR